MESTDDTPVFRRIPAFAVPLAVLGGFALISVSRSLPASVAVAWVGGALMVLGLLTPVLRLSAPKDEAKTEENDRAGVAADGSKRSSPALDEG